MYVISDKTVRISDRKFTTSEKLPVANWLVKVDEGGFFLEKQEPFELPDKIYGDLDGQVERYLNTFNSRTKNLGILLNGLKGTGKSLTAKKLCIDSGLPVILITQAYAGTGFESFLSTIKEECIVFIDEFEKTYQSNGGLDVVGDPQSTLLTILDGVFESKKLFLLTSNFSHKVNDALINRPSRIHYIQNYEGLEDSVINDVIDDLLEDKTQKEGLLQGVDIIGEVNMDVLVSLIKEMNLYKESASDALKMLNIKPADSSYEVKWTARQRKRNDDSEQEYDVNFEATIGHHPLSKNYIDLYGHPENFSDHWSQEFNIEFDKSTKILNMRNRTIELEHDGIIYAFTKKKAFKFTYAY